MLTPTEIIEARKKMGLSEESGLAVQKTTKGTDLLNKLQQKVTEKPQVKESFLDKFAKPGERIIDMIGKTGDSVADAIRGEGQYEGLSAVERGVGATAQGFSAISGTIYNTLPDKARNTLDKIGGGIGKGVEYLADKISENPALQKFAVSEAGKDTARVTQVLSDLGIIAGETLGVVEGVAGIEKLNRLEQVVRQKMAGYGGDVADEISRHVGSAKQVLTEMPDKVATPDGMQKLVDQTRANIQLQFRNEGLVKLADRVSKVSASTIDELADNVVGILESPTTMESLAGASRGVQAGVDKAIKPFTDLITDTKGVINVKTPAATTRKAKMQGYNDQDIKFVQTMEVPDKTVALKMQELAEKVVSPDGKRITERPIDLVGETFIQKIKPIEQLNKQAGKAVDEAAKSLKGQSVDSTPLQELANSLADELEVFKYTPELSKKIEQFIQDVPKGQVDAYELHIFKKAIDELVNYGTSGEGLKGKSSSMLKQLRATADEILDTNFESYNKANTDFKATIDVLENARDLFGKQGFSDVKGGQVMRSVFSNSARRSDVLGLLKQIDELSKKYNIPVDGNLIDQALFALMLEDIYGTQAITSFRGQIEKAISGVQKVTQIMRDPIKGVGEVGALVTEKALGISEEGKKAILRELLLENVD